MARDITIVTTDQIPMPHTIEKFWNMKEFTTPVEISEKGFIRGIIEKNKNEHQEAFDNFLNSIPEEANAVIGVKISTSAQDFTNGRFLYITYIGTPVKYTLKNS